ncbi:MAG TPA: GNAT family N-acetyltransferase [Phycisphaerales bacterium]
MSESLSSAASVTIRPATEADAASLADLCGQLGYPTDQATMVARLREASVDRNRAVIVADLQGRAVGCLELAVQSAFENGTWPEIRGLVVDANCRSGGIGAALVAFAKEWSRERGFKRLRVRTNEIRTRTHAFYEREGFTKTKSQRVYDVDL